MNKEKLFPALGAIHPLNNWGQAVTNSYIEQCSIASFVAYPFNGVFPIIGQDLLIPFQLLEDQ